MQAPISQLRHLLLAIALLAALSCPAISRAQAPTWQTALSGNNNSPGSGTSTARATAVDASGNVFVTGSITGDVTFGNTRLVSAGNTDMFLAKWDATASTWAWAVRGGGNNIDQGNGVAVYGNSVYVTGNFTNIGSITIAGTPLATTTSQDMFLAKYTDNGSTVTPVGALAGGSGGTETGLGVAVSSTGSVFVTGSFSGTTSLIAGTTLTNAGGTDVYLAKYVDVANALPTDVGALRGGGTGNDAGQGVAVSGSSVYVTGFFSTGTGISIAGTTLSSAGVQDMYLAKYTDGAGLPTNVGAVRGGGGSTDQGNSVAVGSNGVYVAGVIGTSGTNSIAGTALTSAGGSDMFLAKYSTAAGIPAPQGAVRGGGTSTDLANGVAVSSGVVYVTGNFTSSTSASIAGSGLVGAGNTDIYVARYGDTTSPLNSLGAVSGGGTAADQGLGVAATVSAVYLACLTGTAVASFGSSPAQLAPLSSGVLGRLVASNLTWVGAEGPLQGTTSRTRSTAVDASGNVFVTGQFSGTVGFGTTRLVSAGNTDIYLAKWNATTQAWAWAVSGGGTGLDSGTGVAVSGNSVYITGTFTSATSASIAGTALAGAGLQDMFLAKYTDNGSTVTPVGTVASGCSNNDQGGALAVGSTGVYVTGTFDASSSTSIAGTVLAGAGNNDMFLAKYTNAAGLPTAVGAVEGGGIGFDAGSSVAVSSTGVYVTGIFGSNSGCSIAGTALAGAGGSDMFLAKYTDTAGLPTPVGAVSEGGGSNEQGQGVAVSAGSVYVTGFFLSATGCSIAGTALAGAGGSDMFLAKYTDAAGLPTPVGAVSGGGTSTDSGMGVAANASGVYVTGYFQSGTSASIAGTALTGAGNNDMFLAKYSIAAGLPVSVGAIAGGGVSPDQGLSVAASNSAVYVGGYITPTASIGSTTLANPFVVEINVLAQVITGTPPTLTALSANSGVPGSAINLTGTDLTGAGSVTFSPTGGGAATAVSSGFTVASATSITGVVVPAGLTGGTYLVTVTSAGGTSNSLVFTVTAPQLSITQNGTTYANNGAAYNFGPVAVGSASAGVAFVLTNTGTAPLHLSSGTTTGPYTVSYGTPGIPATLLPGATATVAVTLTPTVAGPQPGTFSIGSDAGTSPIYVVNLTGAGQPLVPVLTSLLPGSGSVGTSVIITGNNLSGATGVSFNGATQTAIANNTATGLTVAVPAGATTGIVTVTTAGGTSNGLPFTVTLPLTITSVSPVANSHSAARTSPVQVSFSQAVTSGSTAALKVFSAQRGGLRSSQSGSTTANSNVVSFAPTYAFKPGETVQATITTAATASAGGNLATARVLQFMAATSAGPGTFNGGSDPAVGPNPRSVAVGDVDGDGDLDVLAGNGGSNTVSVRLNNGNGTYSGITNVATGAGPFSVAVGDVDGDGDLDVLAANLGDNTVSVRLNNGSGTFAGSPDVAVGRNPYSLALGDMDGDGDLDIISASEFDNTASVYFNNGNAVFSGSTSVAVGASPQSVAVGDVDSDGDLDVFTANFNANTVSVRFNDGMGTLSGSTDVAVGSIPIGVAVGDVDGDGDLDILAANLSSSTVSVRLNNGNGAFSGGTDPTVGNSPISVALGDVDGDGDLDIFAATSGTNTVSVRLNNGNGVFSGGTNVLVGTTPWSVAVGDVDGDGDLDVLAANNTASGTVSVRLNANVAPAIASLSPSSGPLGTTISITGTNLASTTAVTFSGSTGNVVSTGFTVNQTGTQINGIVVPNGATTGNVTVVTAGGTSNGLPFTVTLPLTITNVMPTANTHLAARTSPVQVTFNQAVTAGSTAALKVFSSQRSGLRSRGTTPAVVSGSTVTYTPPAALPWMPGETVFSTVTTTATASGGGSLATPKVVQFTAAAGVGPGTFSGGSDPAVGNGPNSVVLGDVDGDGDLDLLAVNRNSNTVSVRLNNGSGVFSGGSDLPVGGQPFGMTVGDVDGDGDLDLLTANANDRTVSVRLNDGLGIFSGGSDPAVSEMPRSVVLGDVDSDGDLDLITANFNSNTVSVRLNNGNGTFSGGSDPAMGSLHYSVAMGDVDMDGDLDLLAANDNGTVSVRLNNGSGVFGGGSDPAVGGGTYSVAVGDVDGDGDLDLLTANNGNNTVSVRLNNGSGVFSGGSNPSVGSLPNGVVVGDVDGDGDLDLLAANNNSNTVSVRLNNGSGIFSGGSDPTVNNQPYGITLGDVDGDGDLDLLTSSPNLTSVSVRLNQSAPTITTLNPTSGPVGTSVTLTGSNLTGATSVSFNGTTQTAITNNTTTGLTVVVPAGATTGNVNVTTPGGISNGLLFTVAPPLTITSISPTSNTHTAAPAGPVQVTFSEPITSSSIAALKVFTNQRGGLRSGHSGSTTASGSTVSFAPTYAFKPGEIVQTTVTTAATASSGNSMAKGRVQQFRAATSGGTGNFQPPASSSFLPAVGSPTTSAVGLVVGDIDGNGTLDLVTLNSWNTLSVRMNNGTGVFTPHPVNPEPLSSSGGHVGAALGDLDNNGTLDLVVGGEVFFNPAGDGNFIPATTGSISGAMDVALGDLNGDGWLDMAISSRYTDIYLNDGAGNLTIRPTIGQVVMAGSVTDNIELGDLDGDGDLDLVGSDFSDVTVSIRLNDGNGNFTPPATNADIPLNNSSTYNYSEDLVLGDLDNDGDLDFAASSNMSGSIYIGTNNGTGNFSVATGTAYNSWGNRLALGDLQGTGTLSVVTGGGNRFVLADIDGDGDVDHLIAGGNRVMIMLNESTPPTLTSISPGSGLPGTTVTLTGSHLVGTTTIVFGGTANNRVTTGFTVNAAGTQITGIVVPAGATTGSVYVLTAELSNILIKSSNGVAFIVPTPALTSLSLSSGPVGTSVTLTGSNLAGATSVSFNGTAQTTITNNTATGLTVAVPAGASTGNVTVTTAGGTSNGLPFMVTLPLTITNVSPVANTHTAARTSPVQVAFSQPLTSGSTAALKVFSAQRGGLRTGHSGTTTVSSNAVSFVPTYAFKPGETVQMSVTTAATAAAGGSLVAGRVHQFTAAATGGTGTFVFSPHPDPAVGSPTSFPVGLAVGDLDGNGTLDLVTSNTGSTLSVRLNNGTGLYTAPAVNPEPVVGGGQARNLSLGDVDGNGTLDAVVACGYLAQVMLNTAGDGNLVAPAANGTITPGFGGSAFDLALGDLNGDGWLDLAVTGFRAASIYLNDGAGNFTVRPAIAQVAMPGSLAESIALGDLDGDGDLDMVVADYSDNTVSIRLNDGSGSFTPPATNADLNLNVSFGNAEDVVLGDMDGDGDLDFVVSAGAGFGSNAVTIGLNDGTGSFNLNAGTAYNGPFGGSSNSGYLALGDLQGTGTFTIARYTYNLALADVDGDGDLDRLVPQPAGPLGSSVNIMLNQNAAATLTSISPGSGLPGSTVALTGTNLTGTTTVTFGGVTNNAVTTGFVVNAAGTQITGIVVPAGASTGNVYVTTSAGNSNGVTFTVPVAAQIPAITSLSPASGLPGDVVTISGSNLGGTTSVSFNGTVQSSITGNTATGLSVAVPAGTTSGLVTVTTPSGTSNGIFFTVLGDLVVSTTQSIQGSYRNVTVTSTGRATLSGALVVRGAMVVQPTGSLNIAMAGISGSGSFILGRRATLTLADIAGISASGPTGAIQVTGTRTFSPDAYYIYNSAADQSTGTGLPGRVARLTHLPNNAFLTRTNPVAVREVLALHSNTTAAFVGGAITLLSDADTTAAVDYSTGSSYAGTYTVQRHVKGDRFAGAAYRHVAAPVAGATVGSLAVAGGFQPTVNAAYNTSATPLAITPFPTVLGYDETRLTTTTNNLDQFSKGWVSPAALSTPLAAGRGYTVHMAANQTMRFVGTVRSGSVTVPLTRGTGIDAGWALVGNPFAAPFNMSSLANTPGMDNAKYVFESTGPYAGAYRTYLPGSPALGNPMVALGQGFFTRVSAANNTATLTMNSANTTVGDPTVFHRDAAEARPLLTLALTNPARTLTDETSLYLQAGIPAGVDGTFDAVKLPNPSGLNLAQVAAGQQLAIQGLPSLTAVTVIPLAVAVPAVGTYTLSVAQLRNLPAGTTAVLVDALTGTRTNLVTPPATGYAFTVTAAQTATAGTGRFFLNLTPATALATAAPFTASLGLYPNPAKTRVMVLVPAVAGAAQVQATLLNALGQVVCIRTAALPANGVSLGLDVAGLARGVYTLRLSAGATTATKRLVLD